MQMTKGILIKCLKLIDKGDVADLLYNLEKAVIHLHNNYDIRDDFKKSKLYKVEKIFGR